MSPRQIVVERRGARFEDAPRLPHDPLLILKKKKTDPLVADTPFFFFLDDPMLEVGDA